MKIIHKIKIFSLSMLGMLILTDAMSMDYQASAKQAEHDFAMTMAQRDFDKFASYIDENAVFISKNTARGKAAVLKQWGSFFQTEAAPFSWQQDWVEVIEPQKLAFSHGSVYGPDGKMIGKFSSIWQLNENGEWKIIFDKAEDHCAPDE